jgi:hypothetical protein
MPQPSLGRRSQPLLLNPRGVCTRFGSEAGFERAMAAVLQRVPGRGPAGGGAGERGLRSGSGEAASACCGGEGGGGQVGVARAVAKDSGG